MQFNNFDIDAFLQDHWQQKPKLFRNAWSDWQNPVSPDELAGLACEEHVESRLVAQTAENLAVENGPIPETRFGDLGRENWTLLVQAVDHYVPEVAALIEPFRFIPNWRIDDVMVSFASDGGGVGAHYDQYDVFLVQGSGKRRWQVGEMCNESTELLEHDDLRLLANFEASEEWVLEPGDMLYVPPGISHNGVAVGDDCMTYSIGFRAPSKSDLIGYWADDLLAEMNDDDRYRDAGLKPQTNPGEMSGKAIDRLHAMITEKMADREAFANWFGKYNSTPKYPDVDWRPEEEMTAAEMHAFIESGHRLQRNPASRLSYIERTPDSVSLFADGKQFECTAGAANLAQQICAQSQPQIGKAVIASDNAAALVTALYNQGSLFFESA